MSASVQSGVDFAIITIKEEEFDAVLRRYPPTKSRSGLWEYNVADVPVPGVPHRTYRVAIVRCLKQATNEAQSITAYVIEDLEPRWILLVGIAGAIPAPEYTLGDVVVSTRIYDLNVGALAPGDDHQYAITSDSIHEDFAPFIANLPANRAALGDWNAPERIGRSRPGVDVGRIDELLNGDEEWKAKIKSSIQRHFGSESARTRNPVFTAGPIASSDDLIKDPRILQRWLTHARDIYAVEMESAGVHAAARRRGHSYPFVSIRGLSDVVGLTRDHDWTMYACETAGSFTRAFTDMLAPRPKRTENLRPRLDPPVDKPPPELVVPPGLAPPTDPLVVVHHVAGRDVTEAYLSRGAVPSTEAISGILTKLNWHWREPLSSEERALLDQQALTPGVNYPSPGWVIEALDEAPDFIASTAEAIRGTARWPESYRLNYVRQLSTTNLTRALGAGHTRLAHTLGTLDVAACLLSSMATNSPGVVHLQRGTVREWIIATLLYAFLHDRYHGPLGHSLDPMSWMLTQVATPEDSQSALRRLDKTELDRQVRLARTKKTHPIRRLIEHVLERIGPGDGRGLRSSVLEKLHLLVRLAEHETMPPEWRFFQDVIDSSLDADRLDYLWRDALHLAARDGDINTLEDVLQMPDARPVAQLVASAAVVAVGSENRLAFAARHRRVAEALLSLRVLFYMRFYESTEKRVLDELVTRTIHDVLDHGGALEDGRVASERIGGELRWLTDSDLFRFVGEVAGLMKPDREPLLPSKVSRTLQDILQARPWTVAWEVSLDAASLERERRAWRAVVPLVERLGAESGLPQEDAGKVAQRRIAEVGLSREDGLAELFDTHGLDAADAPRLTRASTAVDFDLVYGGTFEAMRRCERELWNVLMDDAYVAPYVQAYRASHYLEPHEEPPVLIVLGVVTAALPALDDVVFYDRDDRLEPDPGDRDFAGLMDGQSVFRMFAAVHPCLHGVAPRIRETVQAWFDGLRYLDI
ncbi:MAG: hypothetical protein RMA76_08690 [Deltaproteobacteria bacterium]